MSEKKLISTTSLLNSENAFLWMFLSSVLILILGYFVYSALFYAPFYQDDTLVILQNSWIKHMPPNTWFGQRYADSSQIFEMYRPTLMMSYWLNQFLIPGNLEFSLRLGSLILLFTNGYLISRLAGVFFENDRYVPYLIGLIYILHPIQTLCVVYAWKRSTLLLTFFVLLGLQSYIQNRHQKSTYDGRFILFQIFCFAGAITSKEEGIVYPLILSICGIIYSQQNSISSLKAKIAFFGFHLSMIAALDLLIWKYTGSHIWDVVREPSRLVYLKQSLFVVAIYFKNMIIPQPLLFAEPADVTTWWNFHSCITLGLFLTSLILLFIRKIPIFVKISLLLIWIGFLPNSSLQPLLVRMDQIRMHVPLVGFALLLGGFIHLIPQKKIRYTTWACLLTIYAIMSFQQSVRYLQPILIWKDIVAQYPKSKLAWDQLGSSLESQKDFAMAAAAFRISYDIDRSSTDELIRSLVNRLRAGESKDVIVKEYRNIRLSDIHSKYIDFHMGVIQLELGFLDEAESTFREFLKYYPNYFQAHFALGAVFERKHLPDLSRQAYQNTLLLNPDYEPAKTALKNLAN